MRTPPVLYIVLALTAVFCNFCGERSSRAPDNGSLRFSHALHLQQPDISCRNCHTAIDTSTVAIDNNLPKEAACLVCHTDDPDTPSAACVTCHVDPDRAETLANRDRVIKFDHEWHLSLENLPATLIEAMDAGVYPVDVSAIRPLMSPDNECETCHRGLRETDFTSDFNRPMMSDCVVCHSATESDDRCYFCHVESFELFPADHTETAFYDDHDDMYGENPALCQQCHEPGSNSMCQQCH